MKKTYLTAIIIALILAGGLTVYIWQAVDFEDYPASYTIPENAGLTFRFSADSAAVKSVSDALYRQLAGDHDHLIKLDSQFFVLAGLVESYHPFQQVLEAQDLYLSFHTTASRRFDPLITIRSNGNVTAANIEAFLDEHFRNLNIRSRRLEGYTLYDVQDADHISVFSFSVPDGIIIVSSNTVLVEDAIRSYVRNKDEPSAFVSQIEQAAPSSNMFFNFGRSAELLSTLFRSDMRIGRGQNPFYPLLGHYEARLTSNGFAFSGNTFPLDSMPPFLAALSNQQSINQELARRLPERTGYYTAFGVSDYNAWLKEVLDKAAIEDQVFRDELLEWGSMLGREWAAGLYEPPSANYHSRRFLISTTAQGDISEKWGTLNLKALDEKGLEADSQEVNGHTFLRLGMNDLIPWLFSPLAGEWTDPYFALYNDLIIIAPDPLHLERIIQDLDAGSTLSQSGRYRSYEEAMLSEAGLSVYFNPRRLSQVPAYFLHNDMKEQFRDHSDIFQRIRHGGLQLAGNVEGFYARGYAEISGDVDMRTELLWSRRVDRDIKSGPFVVVNHEDNSRELLVQDEGHTIYLINQSGDVLWDLDLPSAIVGEVQQIDLYDNERLQYLFVTEQYIHLIDRNGNYVANYPISLSSPASAGLAVFDFRGDGSYRYFVPTVDRAIYGFRKDGRPLSGWDPKRIRGNLTHPLKYFVFQGGTYLTSTCDNGFLYLLDVTANDIKGPFDIGAAIPHPVYASFGPDASQTYVYAADSAGMIKRFNLKGDKDTMQFTEPGTDHYLDFLDFTGSRSRNFVFTYGGVMEVYSKDSIRGRRYNLARQPAYPPLFFKHNGETAFGYVVEEERKAYVHGHDGYLLHGFPVPAGRPLNMADLNRDGNEELITADGNQILVYRIR